MYHSHFRFRLCACTVPTTQAPVTEAPTTFSDPTNSTETTAVPTMTALTVAPTSAPTSTPVGDCEVLNFKFFEDVDDEELDILADGYTPGDVYLFNDNGIFVGEQQVGTSRGRCVVMEDLDVFENLYCTIEFVFGGGSLLVQGVFFELMAVGGTGCYADAHGWISLDDDPDDYTYGYTFRTDNNFTEACPDDSVRTNLLASPWMESGLTEDGLPTEEQVDWDGNGQSSAGDVTVFDTNAFVTATGLQAHLEGECMTLYDPTADRAGREFCTMSFYTEVDGDTLMVQGPFDNMVITSAVGCFYGVSGIVSGFSFDNGDHRYDLLLDDPDATVQDVACPGLNIFNETWTEPYGDLLVNYIFEPNDSENTTDYDKYTAGDTYVFDNKVISISNTATTGIISGRCVFLGQDESIYCSMVIEMMDDMGSIALQGDFDKDFDKMTVVGGSRCFQGLQGVVLNQGSEDGFLYHWTVTKY